MGATNKGITVVAKLLGGKGIDTEAKGISKSYKGMGEAAKKADKDAEQSGKGWELFSAKAKKAAKDNEKTHRSLLKTAGGAAAGLVGGYGAISLIKGAADTTAELGEETEKFHAITGMSANSSLRYVAALKARGIGAEAGGNGYKFLAKNVLKAEEQERSYALGEKKATESKTKYTGTLGLQARAFQKLGIGVKEFAALSPEKQFSLITDKLSHMKDGAEKTRLEMQLLGKGGAALGPLFEGGALGLKHQLDMAKKFFPMLKGNGVRALEELKAKQAESKMAWEGIQFTIGQKLIPVITKVEAWFSKLTLSVEKGKGAWGEIAQKIGGAIGVLKSVITWVANTEGALVTLGSFLTVLGGLWAVNKVIGFVNAIKGMVLGVRAAAIAWGLYTPAQTGADAAMDANPIGVIVLGLTALGVGIYMAIKHWKAIKNTLVGVWRWIKGHAYVLAGVPVIGPMIWVGLEIYKHWNGIVHFFTRLPGKLASAGKGMWDWIKNEFKDAIDFILGIWNKFAKSLAFTIHLPEVAGVGGGSIHFGGLPQIPMLWQGGTVRRSGLSVVGDRGPELLHLPAGARVDPLPASHRGGANQSPGTWNGSNGDLTVICQIDRKEVGRAVVTEFNREAARRG